MNQITTDPTTLKHALRNLNKNEILLILQDFNFIDMTIPTKQGLIDYIINLLAKSQLPEDMYLVYSILIINGDAFEKLTHLL